MAHADGWVDAYGYLEEGRQLPDDLKTLVSKNRNGIGETMLQSGGADRASIVVTSSGEPRPVMTIVKRRC